VYCTYCKDCTYCWCAPVHLWRPQGNVSASAVWRIWQSAAAADLTTTSSMTSALTSLWRHRSPDGRRPWNSGVAARCSGPCPACSGRDLKLVSDLAVSREPPTSDALSPSVKLASQSVYEHAYQRKHKRSNNTKIYKQQCGNDSDNWQRIGQQLSLMY